MKKRLTIEDLVFVGESFYNQQLILSKIANVNHDRHEIAVNNMQVKQKMPHQKCTNFSPQWWTLKADCCDPSSHGIVYSR